MASFRKDITCKKCSGPIRTDRVLPFCSKKCEAQETGYSRNYTPKELKEALDGSTAWTPLPPEPIINITTGYPVLVIGDTHMPLHDIRWMAKAIEVAQKFECKICVINGDLIDATQISRHLGKNYRGQSEFEDDLSAAEKVLDIFLSLFDYVYYTSGNHSQRLVERFAGEVSFQRLMKLIHSSERFKVTERTYLDINSKVRTLHPRSYSRIRGKQVQELSQRYQISLITSHHHHSAETISADGNFQCIEIGCMADVKKFRYSEYNMMGMPEMLLGFAIVLPESEKNKIINFNKFTRFSTYGVSDIEDDL